MLCHAGVQRINNIILLYLNTARARNLTFGILPRKNTLLVGFACALAGWCLVGYFCLALLALQSSGWCLAAWLAFGWLLLALLVFGWLLG